MNILLIGNGGREHAMAMKFIESAKCTRLFVVSGNAGTERMAENIQIATDDFKQLGTFCSDNHIDLIVVGPEAPLVNGIRDYFQQNNLLSKILMVGPDRKGAQLEGSKDFSKQFMKRHKIPTAKSKTFDLSNLKDGLEYIDQCDTPIVLKADGLAAGKGVIISSTKEHAKATLREMVEEKKFGEASSKVLIEEYLDGIELSVFVLTDGKNYVLLPEAKDYKRIGDGDTGPNTGGMGAISPVPFANKEFMEKVREQIIIPTIDGLQKEKIDYKGFVFIGIMNVDGNPFVIEYNVRMGDPETQVVLPRIKNDFVDLMVASANGTLDQHKIEVINEIAATVVLVSAGYPGEYEKGRPITMKSEKSEALIVHAGTKYKNDLLLTDGGRVMSVTGLGESIEQATENAYSTISKISWEGLYFRKDIGKDLVRYTKPFNKS